MCVYAEVRNTFKVEPPNARYFKGLTKYIYVIPNAILSSVLPFFLLDARSYDYAFFLPISNSLSLSRKLHIPHFLLTV